MGSFTSSNSLSTAWSHAPIYAWRDAGRDFRSRRRRMCLSSLTCPIIRFTSKLNDDTSLYPPLSNVSGKNTRCNATSMHMHHLIGSSLLYSTRLDARAGRRPFQTSSTLHTAESIELIFDEVIAYLAYGQLHGDGHHCASRGGLHCGENLSRRVPVVAQVVSKIIENRSPSLVTRRLYG
ncbi:hypothetical protein HYPSUDRAFT_818610 [Hypholoma sublateritium FD-334 SS-4]|uniref:Uncharacterized protein n=1 Tax=Hypholoma sublateritium (strain FD-334 SS-4) TaxID=945553 RepID=A0A0D2MAL0_HYPSF|nr:hypothetical protein HYPSUDRAFT_818610 [Hypholoma sublateritium FD-334 SS-4]